MTIKKVDMDVAWQIYESKHTKIALPKRPHVTREDGGHLVVYPKRRVKEIYELDKDELLDCFLTVSILSAAMKDVLAKNDIIIENFNIQDNGNWSFLKNEELALHIHIYGRTKANKYQKFGEALYLPYAEDNPKFYDRNLPIEDGELQEIIEIFKKEYDNNQNQSYKIMEEIDMTNKNCIKDEEMEKVAGGLPPVKPRQPEVKDPFGYAVGTIRKFKGLNMNKYQTWDYIEANWGEFVGDMACLGYNEIPKEELRSLIFQYWDQYDYV